jgi:predicted flap endonuclease-1-like 5' DNA nuclease
MPEITAIHIVLLLASACLGAWLGWLWRSRRAVREKTLLNAQWQDQLESQRDHQHRLAEQNKTLMEQNSHFRASTEDASLRATELSGALEAAVERRDKLQRQIEEVRANLEAAVNERIRLQTDTRQHAALSNESALADRDATIAKLVGELKNWQSRLPPLIERYQVRDAQAVQLEAQLTEAGKRIRSLESMLAAAETQAEADTREAPGDGGDAGNGSAAPQPGAAASPTLANAAETGADAATAPTSGVTAQDARDDLKMIKGVGPAIEKTLNEMGVFRFDQIAAMTELEIDRIAHRLKGLRSRIYREDWIGQARELQLQTAD